MPAVYDDEKLDNKQDGQHDDLGVDPVQRQSEAKALREKLDASSDSGKEDNPGWYDGDSLENQEKNAGDKSGPSAQKSDRSESAAVNKAGGGADVSREGVQRDLLPIVEGSTVNTKFGIVNTDHILFIAAGAFHFSKPSDLIPELQGRFPIRVELQSLSVQDFEAILNQTHASLVKQYQALMTTENVTLEFTAEGVTRLAQIAFEVNERTENIGARRLSTVMERLLDEVSFEAPHLQEKTIVIDAPYVRRMLADIVKNEDLSRYIL